MYSLIDNLDTFLAMNKRDLLISDLDTFLAMN